MRWILAALLTTCCTAPAVAQQLRLDDLADADGAKAYRAVWRFAANPDAAVALLRDHLKLVAPADPRRLRRLLTDLQSDDFTERDTANTALIHVGDLAEDALRAALKQDLALEARRRIEALLERLDGQASDAGERRIERSVEVLETIGSADARALLQQLAKGAPSARLTRLANEADVRLGRRLPMPLGKPPSAKTDGDGNPLPAGAIARLGTLRFRSGAIFGGKVFFTPDSCCVATWRESTLEPLRLFDLPGGKVVREIAVPWSGRTDPFAFSPDGKTLAYVCTKKKAMTLEVIDWPLGTKRASHDLGTPGNAEAMAFIGNAVVVLVWSDRTVRTCDLRAGITERRKITCPFQANGPWRFSPDGKFLAAAAGQQKRNLYYLWEWQTDKPARTIAGPERGFTQIAFAPDGRTLATCSDSDVVGVRLWSVATGKLVRRFATDHANQRTYYPAFSHDGRTLAASHYGAKGIVLWEVATGKVQHVLPGGAHFAFSPDDRWIAARSFSAIGVWDRATGVCVSGDAGHVGPVDHIAYSPRGDVLATTASDGTVRLWDANTGKPTHVLRHDEHWVRDMAFAPDGKRLASSCFDDTVRVWDVDTGTPIHRLVGHGQLGGRRVVRFTTDAKRLVSWGDDYCLRVFDMATGKALSESRPAPKGSMLPAENEVRNLLTDELFMQLRATTMVPDGSQLVFPSLKGGLEFFDVATAKRVRSLAGEMPPLWTLHFAPDQKSVLLHSFHNSSNWDVLRISTGNTRLRFNGTHATPAWSPDGRTIAAIEPDRVVLWEVATGTKRLTIPNAPDAVSSVAFSPDGRRLAIGMTDGTVVIWDLGRLTLE
jgi:WD40 repeat protein